MVPTILQFIANAKNFFGKLLKRLVNGQCIGNILNLKQ